MAPIRRLQRFEEEAGEQLDLRLDGYLFLADNSADVERFEADLVHQVAAGIETQVLTPEEAQGIVPQLAVDDLRGAVFNPVAVSSRPTSSYRAARGGRPGSGRGWSSRARRNGSSSRAAASPASTPDFSTSFHFHREGEEILFGGREQSLDDLAPHAATRLPALAELEVRHTISGFYEMSPDHNAVIGAAAEPMGLVYATGFSGHRFQQGLVVGEHLAQLALGLEPTFDLSQFDVKRFARGTTRAELNVI
jgi:sarcosine oxidase, subunit beta